MLPPSTLEASAIGVRVRTLSGESIALSGVRATDTIGDLKALVEAAAGIARAHQRLTFKHAPLAIDERSLVSHGVRDGATLHLAIVVPGQSARAEPQKHRSFGLLYALRIGLVHPT